MTLSLSGVTRRPRRAKWLPAVGALALLGACAPELDWRDVRPPGTALQAQLPCKPTTQDRQVQLADTRVRLVLMACAAGGQTWGLATADLADPARVQQALVELAASSATNIGASGANAVPWLAPGATPNPAAVRQQLLGRLPDGKPVQMQMAVFAHGTRVFQASVLGERLGLESVDVFFGAVRLTQ